MFQKVLGNVCTICTYAPELSALGADKQCSARLSTIGTHVGTYAEYCTTAPSAPALWRRSEW